MIINYALIKGLSMDINTKCCLINLFIAILICTWISVRLKLTDAPGVESSTCGSPGAIVRVRGMNSAASQVTAPPDAHTAPPTATRRRAILNAAACLLLFFCFVLRRSSRGPTRVFFKQANRIDVTLASRRFSDTDGSPAKAWEEEHVASDPVVTVLLHSN